MKSVEEIQRRLKDVEASESKSLYTDMVIGYLKLALTNYNKAYYLEHLLNKYQFENAENEAIIETLE